MLKKYITNNRAQTQKLGEKLAKEILKLPTGKGATVLALSGNLGGGKTTFLQGFAKGLGIKEKILSPTYVILKRFKITKSKFTDFYHIDFYRLNNRKDIVGFDFKNIIKNPKNIVAIEWPEKVGNIIPKNQIEIKFNFIDEKTREINFET